MSTLDLTQVRQLAQQLRVDSVRSSSAAKSGHPTSSMSASDLIATLAARHFRYDHTEPDNLAADHLVFSKGHASPLLYSLFKAIGAIDDAELLTFRKLGSRLEGHPTPVLPWVDVATGSLGQGLPIAVGMALAAKLQQSPSRIWTLCGDSEMAEGSIWEAAECAGFENLGNLIAIIDVNRLGQRGQTRHGWDLNAYTERLEAFGWQCLEIDGHDVDAIDAALTRATAANQTNNGSPWAIIARTVKGRGVSAIADADNAHGKPVADEDQAVEELGGRSDVVFRPPAPPEWTAATKSRSELKLPVYEVGEKVATRKAYGEALVAVGSADPDVVALDGEVGNSTYAEIFAAAHPARFFEMYIAEQQLIAAAVGMQTRGLVPFASTFAAFLSRGYDFVRMAAVSRASIRLCGSHAGVSIGEDGPSQMALEDLASLRAIHGSTVLYPCDANQTAQLVATMADLTGISYLRTTRGETPVIYPADQQFEVGGSRVVRSTASGHDDITIFAAGITLHEALSAADLLATDGIKARVIDLYSVKPLDAVTVRDSLVATNGVGIVVEDHWPEGGLGDAVLDAVADLGVAFRLAKLAVRDLPGSGTPQELLAGAGIDAASITETARGMLK